MVKRNNSNIQLYIAGDGECKNDLLQCAKTCGVTEDVILLGDMFTWANRSGGKAGYNYLAGKGYKDSQVTAVLNCNGNTKHGTFHDPMNASNTSRASEDFVWYTSELKALKFGVITTPEATNTSDHWPVFADLSFK